MRKLYAILGLLWMLFWEVVFVLFILPWAWIPIALELWGKWNEKTPRFVKWIITQAKGDF